MGRDGAESAAAEAAAVHVDRVAYHLVGRNHFVLIARVRHTGVGEVKRSVDLGRGHRRQHRVDLDGHAGVGLPEGGAVHAVALLLDVAEVLGLTALVDHAEVKAVEYDVVTVCLGRDLVERTANHSLGYIGDISDPLTGSKTAGYFQRGLLAHSVGDEVGLDFGKNRRAQAVLPVVVVRGPTPPAIIGVSGNSLRSISL